MPSRKQPSQRTRRPDTGVTARDPRERGLQAFNAGRFDDAIAIWSRLMQVDRTIFSVLAEAHFRRALARTLDEDRLDDLRRALELRPRDFRYQYHLGLALHRLGDLDGALERYRAVVGQDPGIPGAGLVLALAHLERDPRTDVTTLPGYDTQVHALLAPVQALLHSTAPAAGGDTPIERLWRGLALIPKGDGSARELMADNRKLPSALAANVRRYYLGVAAAQAGDLDGALQAWQHVRDQYMDTPWLRDNLTAAILQRVSEDDGADPDRTAQFVHRAAKLAAGTPALAGVLVEAMHEPQRSRVIGCRRRFCGETHSTLFEPTPVSALHVRSSTTSLWPLKHEKSGGKPPRCGGRCFARARAKAATPDSQATHNGPGYASAWSSATSVPGRRARPFPSSVRRSKRHRTTSTRVYSWSMR